MNAEDLKTAAAVGAFLLAAGGIFAAWIAWRAVVAVKLDRMGEDLKALADQQSKRAAQQLDFEREVRKTYDTGDSIADLRLG